MKADLTMSQVWYNHSLMNFFFRAQSENTILELHDRIEGSWDDALDRIEDHADLYNLDLDDIEEMFYEESVEELAKEFGLDIYDNEEDEEDE